MENLKKNKLQKYVTPKIEIIQLVNIDMIYESEDFDKGEWDHI